jgi:nicotinamide riboside kinase
MSRGYVVAVVGAESTGKTTLARALAGRLAAEGHDAVTVAEHLREWCETHARTPRADEQRAIADAQTARIDAAAASHEIVVADTTALMTAVYSDLLFADGSLYDDAVAAQRRCDCTLLTALDLPWVADGQQRDGEHVRVPVDTRVRAALQRAGIGHAVFGGRGAARVAAALAAVHAARRPRAAGGGWHWVCEHCDDGSCERHAARLFTSLHGR